MVEILVEFIINDGMNLIACLYYGWDAGANAKLFYLSYFVTVLSKSIEIVR